MAGTAHIIQSLVANSIIAAGKGVAALLTGSGALLAETLHSAADCGNQLLLLVGVNRSKRPPTAKHPFGYGRDVYFWSFMVAMLLFSGGGVFSIYEGIHKMGSNDPIEKAWLGFLILGASIVIEGWATLGNIREMNKRRGKTPFVRYLRDTKDSDLVVVFGENSAAVLGLALAMIAMALAVVTGNPKWDAIGSLAIGVVLVGVAVFLAIEVKSLLLGEAADPEIDAAVHACAKETPGVAEVRQVLTIQQGPGEVMLAAKLRFDNTLAAAQLCSAINDFERRLREKAPSVKWCFVEPDQTAQVKDKALPA